MGGRRQALGKQRPPKAVKIFPVTLLSPLSPSKAGCIPCVYAGFVTLSPLNTKNLSKA